MAALHADHEIPGRRADSSLAASVAGKPSRFVYRRRFGTDLQRCENRSRVAEDRRDENTSHRRLLRALLAQRSFGVSARERVVRRAIRFEEPEYHRALGADPG